MKLVKTNTNSDHFIAKSALHKSVAVLGITCLLALSGCSEAQQDQATQTLGLDQEDVFSLKVGTCFNDPNGAAIEEDELISDVPVRDCNTPHDNEVFHVFDLPESLEQPEATLVQDAAYTECGQAYATFVGMDYDDSAYEMNYMAPSDESWADGDREIACYLYNPESEQMTASMKGSEV